MTCESCGSGIMCLQTQQTSNDEQTVEMISECDECGHQVVSYQSLSNMRIVDEDWLDSTSLE